MKLPRDISGHELAKRLNKVFGYTATRQTGSHRRLTTQADGREEHHITIPLHPSLRVGTLSSILTEVATYLEISKEEVIRRLFGAD